MAARLSDQGAENESGQGPYCGETLRSQGRGSEWEGVPGGEPLSAGKRSRGGGGAAGKSTDL